MIGATRSIPRSSSNRRNQIMKKVITYSAIVLLLGLTACNKTDSINSTSDSIRFAPASVETRALIEDAAGLQSQTFKVWDFMGTETDPYIDNTIVYGTEGWTYGEPNVYPWADGTHKFFGYTNGAGTFASNVLTVSKALTYTDADLLYSDVFTTTAANWKATKRAQDKVMLDFHHLFAAVSINVVNETTNVVSVISVGTGEDIKNSGSAIIDYNGDDVDVDYEGITYTGDYGAAAFTSAISLNENEMIDVFSQVKSESVNYYVIWPQELDDENPVRVALKYQMNGVEYEKTVSLPAVAWEAGKKYGYTLRILPNAVNLTFRVAEWVTGEAGSITTADGSINMSNVMWMNSKVKLTEEGDEVNTINHTDKIVNMYYRPWVKKTVNEVETWSQYDGFYPAQAYFTVNYPVSGQFKIGLIPAYGQTTVDKSKFEIWFYNSEIDTATNKPKGWQRGDTDDNPGEYVADLPENHETIYFQVRAAKGVETLTSNPEYKAQVDIWFKPDESSEWISAYSEVRSNYATVIPAR